jgi:hypothetical protein
MEEISPVEVLRLSVSRNMKDSWISMQILGFISDDGNIGRQPTYLKKKT